MADLESGLAREAQVEEGHVWLLGGSEPHAFAAGVRATDDLGTVAFEDRTECLGEEALRVDHEDPRAPHGATPCEGWRGQDSGKWTTPIGG